MNENPPATQPTKAPETVKKMETRELTPYNKVRKSKTIIEAKYFLSQPEMKILNAIFSVIKDNAEELGYIELPTKMLCENLNINLRELKEFTYNIVQNGVTFRSVDENGVYEDVQTTWLSSAVYYPTLGRVRFRISEELKPYIIGISKRKEPYTEFETRELISTTYYTSRIYEFACQYLKCGKRPKMSIDELRSMLGIPADKYKLFAHFKDRVLDTAVQAIRSSKELRYEVGYELFKSGRAYTDIVLTVRKKQNGTYQETPKQPVKVALPAVPKNAAITMLMAQGISEKRLTDCTEEQLQELLRIIRDGMNPVVLRQMLGRYSLQRIFANSAIVREKMRSGQGKSFGAMLFTAIQNDWSEDPERKQERRKEEKKQKDRALVKKMEEHLAEERRKETEAAKRNREEKNSMSDFEIRFLNGKIEQGHDFKKEPGMMLRPYLDNEHPRIREAIALLMDGKKIPPDFFQQQ